MRRLARAAGGGWRAAAYSAAQQAEERAFAGRAWASSSASAVAVTLGGGEGGGGGGGGRWDRQSRGDGHRVDGGNSRSRWGGREEPRWRDDGSEPALPASRRPPPARRRGDAVTADMLHGLHPCACAVAAGHRRLTGAWVATSDARAKALAPIMEALAARGVRVTRTDAATLASLAGATALHQGIVVAAAPLVLPVVSAAIETGEGSPAAFIAACTARVAARSARGGGTPAPIVALLLDGVVDPHNLGAILRSAALFGADAVLLPAHDSAPLSPTVSKTSSGALELLAAGRQLWSVRNPAALLPHLQDAGWRIVVAAAATAATAAAAAATPPTPTPSTLPSSAAAPLPPRPHLSSVALASTAPTLLVLGSEGAGVRRAIRDAADATVGIPMSGGGGGGSGGADDGGGGGGAAPGWPPGLRPVDSLNVSVAAGILLHQLRAPPPLLPHRPVEVVS